MHQLFCQAGKLFSSEIWKMIECHFWAGVRPLLLKTPRIWGRFYSKNYSTFFCFLGYLPKCQQNVWVRRYVLPNRIQFGWTRTNEWLQYSDDQPPVVNFKEKRSITDLSANISTLHAQKKALIFMTKSCFCHKNSYKIIKHLCTKKHHGLKGLT